MKRLLLICLALLLVAAPAADAAKSKGKSGKATASKTCSSAKSAKKAKKGKKAKAAANKKSKKAKSAKKCGKKKKAAKKTGAHHTPDAVAAASECRADKADDPEGFAADFGNGADAVDVCVEEILATATDDEDVADEPVEDGSVVDESLPPADEPVDETGFIEEGEGEDVPLI